MCYVIGQIIKPKQKKMLNFFFKRHNFNFLTKKRLLVPFGSGSGIIFSFFWKNLNPLIFWFFIEFFLFICTKTLRPVDISFKALVLFHRWIFWEFFIHLIWQIYFQSNILYKKKKKKYIRKMSLIQKLCWIFVKRKIFCKKS